MVNVLWLTCLSCGMHAGVSQDRAPSFIREHRELHHAGLLPSQARWLLALPEPTWRQRLWRWLRRKGKW